MRRGIVLLCAFALAAAGPGPHKVVRNTSSLDFSYEWPAEAVAIPALDLRLYKDAKEALSEAQANALDDRQLAREQKREFNGHYYSRQWATAGQTRRLLSLQSEMGTFEGGAHPNTLYGALLWDRSAKREITMNSLFANAGEFESVTRADYCAA